MWHHARVLTKPAPGGLTWNHDPAVWQAQERPSIGEYLPSIKVPTLVIRGERSTLITRNMLERVRQAVPKCQVAEIRNTGHWCFDENPIEMERVVRQFLSS